MDRAAHDRFLGYLERFTYFGRGDMARLTREEFATIDEEYQRLSKVERRDAREDELWRSLRAVLLKD